MASFTTTTTTTTTTALICFPGISTQFPFNGAHGTKQNRRIKVSCNDNDHNANANANAKPVTNTQPQKLILPKTPAPLIDMQNVDRRNLLLGLGGLYGATNFNLASSLAVPITAPDISTNCQDANEGFFDAKNTIRGKACCPPNLKKPVKDFVFPTNDKVIRVRPNAHRVDPDYISKYKAAIQAMRDLPDDDPHSFVQQAKIHCAYCNGGYTQGASGKDFADVELQVHNSWLFFPFHRWYLYFYERILGKLINDPTFAIPYWNWDNPTGMTMPPMFETDGKKNSLFDAFRDGNHLPPAAIVDLEYAGVDRGCTCVEQIGINLSAMYKQMVSNATDPLSFFGGEYRAGDGPKSNSDPSVGTIEAGCHTAIHRWVGDPRMPNNEDLGNFYSAGYDPLFFVHHANVDRMWVIWKGLGIKGHKEPTDPDWLNASYVFYDENKELVRVYNKDCVDFRNLKYGYERSEIPWLKNRPVPRVKKAGATTSVKGNKDVKFPLPVDVVANIKVKRPTKSRSKEDKEKENEVLLIRGIRFDGEKFVKFDVYINSDDPTKSPCSVADSEFIGSFAQLPHNHRDKMLMKSAARFGLNEVLDDIGAEDDDEILVTLVPRAGCEDVTVADIKIVLVPIVD